jgi:hypothetical protein
MAKPTLLMENPRRFARSGDSGGDWELALPERRGRRKSARTHGGSRELRWTSARKGNRFAALTAVVSEAEGSESEFGGSEVEAVLPPPPSPVNLGTFWPDLGGGSEVEAVMLSSV